MFQSVRVMKHIHLRLFDVLKGPGWWEGRVRGGDDICLDIDQPKHLLYRSPFCMYLTLSKVSRLSMVNTLFIETSTTIF